MRKYAIIIFICSILFVVCSFLNFRAETSGDVEAQVFTALGTIASLGVGLWLFIDKIMQGEDK